MIERESIGRQNKEKSSDLVCTQPWEVIRNSKDFEEFSEFFISLRYIENEEEFLSKIKSPLTYLRNLGKFARNANFSQIMPDSGAQEFTFYEEEWGNINSSLSPNVGTKLLVPLTKSETKRKLS